MSELVIPARYCGPPRSGNGGWSAGALAEVFARDAGLSPDRVVRVTLHRPPVLDASYDVADGVAVLDGEVMGRAVVSDDELVPVAPVSVGQAHAAEGRYGGHVHHPFPTCFVCGTERAEGDGLRIFPGPVVEDDADGDSRLAATWTPHPDLPGSVPTTWSALDCPSGWAAGFGDTLMVLGRMTARLDRLPETGVEHVLVGEARGTEGRKTFAATSLYDADGGLVGTAEHVWVSVDPAAFV